MSSVMHPVGPQSPSVYWVRRVLVLIGIAAVLAGAAWLLGGGGGDGTGAAPPGPSTTPPPSTPSASPTRTTKPPSTPAASPTRTTPKPTKTATVVPACADSAIDVTASTDAASYRVGATPRLRMQITNGSGAACRRDVGAPANELIVNRGSQRFWASDDCNPGGVPDVVVLHPGESYSVSLSWPGTSSQPGCPASQPVATAGSYSLVGRNGQVMSAPQKFVFTS